MKKQRHKNWDEYRAFQKVCNKSFKKAERKCITRSINKGFEENTFKPFWRYFNSKRQDNIGVSPLKMNETLHYDIATKAEILVNEFKSDFTKSVGELPFINKQYPNINELSVTSPGVHKLLQNLDFNKAVGPDLIPNVLTTKKCAIILAPGLTAIFNRSLQTGSLPND